MNKAEALSVLQVHLQRWRERSWSQLRVEIGRSHRFEETAAGGSRYQGEVQVLWDDKPDGAIRVMASIDDAGWRALAPLTADFILAPDGTFVGE
jgi:hypothetical protein